MGVVGADPAALRRRAGALAAALARARLLAADVRSRGEHESVGRAVAGVLRRVDDRVAAVVRAAATAEAAERLPLRRPSPQWHPVDTWRQRDEAARQRLLGWLHHRWLTRSWAGRPASDGRTGAATLLGADALLDFDGQAGRAVAVFGDLDGADRVAVVVPGIGNDLDNIDELLADARALQQAAGVGVATIAWLGYDAPGGFPSRELLTHAWRGGRAVDGGVQLAGFVRELAAGRGRPARITVIGHSYGSRVIAEAMRGRGLPVDDVVFLGAPGLGPEVADVGDLAPGDTRVWAETVGDPWAHELGDRLGPVRPVLDAALRGLGIPASWIADVTVVRRTATGADPVPYLPGEHGGDPDVSSFGACGFDLGDVRGHGAYFTGTSLANLAAIVRGRPPTADTDRFTDPSCRRRDGVRPHGPPAGRSRSRGE